MKVSTFSRFRKLRDAISDTLDHKRYDQTMDHISSEYGSQLLMRFRGHMKLRHDGEKWIEPEEVYSRRKYFPRGNSPRPSIRTWGVTADGGWIIPITRVRTQINDNTVSYGFDINSKAPQVQMIIDGTKDPEGGIIRPDTAKALFFHDFKSNVARLVSSFVKNRHGMNPDNFPYNIYNRSKSTRLIWIKNIIKPMVFKPLEDIITSVRDE